MSKFIFNSLFLACCAVLGVGLYTGTAKTDSKSEVKDDSTRVVRCDKGETVRQAIAKAPLDKPLAIRLVGICNEGLLEIERNKLTLEGADGSARLNAQIEVDGARDFEISDLVVSGPIGVMSGGSAFIVDHGDPSRFTVIENGIDVGNASFLGIEGGVQIGQEPTGSEGFILRANLNGTVHIANLAPEGGGDTATPVIHGNIQIIKDSKVRLNSEDTPWATPVVVKGNIVCDSESRLRSNDLRGVVGAIGPACMS